MMNDEARRASVLYHEGQVLQHAGHHGSDHAANMARCVIDGAMNALIRLEGVEEASKYAFALSDRVVGRVKEPTPWPLPPLALPPKMPQPHIPGTGLMTWLSGAAVGFILGLLIGAKR